jgi:hypothetical protein
MSTVSQRKKVPVFVEPFLGFPSTLEDGYTQTPNAWFNILLKIDNMAELKIVLYIIRHTWGFRDEDGERDLSKKITTDEFAYGRKLKDGSRFDSGTGLGLTSIKDGVKKALEHRYIFCEVDDSDLARIKKNYGLNLLDEEEEDNSDGRNPTTDSHNVTTDSQNATSNGHNPTASSTQSDQRSEKETPDTNSKKETEEKDALSPFFFQALSFIKEKKTVSFLELEKYMHRFIAVRGHTTINLKFKNLAAWTGSTHDFLQVILDLQGSGQASINLSVASRYPAKGRRPRLPVATVEQDYEELHWYPMVITYTGKE